MKANMLYPSFTPPFPDSTFSSSSLFAHALTISFVTPVTRPVAPGDNGLVVIAVVGGDGILPLPEQITEFCTV